MKRLWLLVAALNLLVVPMAHAQKPILGKRDVGTEVSPGELNATPEMWFYEQERRRYENPRSIIRQKAEFRAAQRQARLAAIKWFGFSNSRPSANPTPMTGPYSPTWTSNSYQPYHWTGVGGSAVIHTADRSNSARY